MISWDEIAARLGRERTYWLATIGADGAPHVSPVWGAVADGEWYAYSERNTVKARNLASDSRVAVHLTDGDDVLIVHGLLADVGHPSDHPQVLDAFAGKYTRPGDREFLPTSDPDFDVLYVLRPSRALAWRLADYSGSQRRWRDRSGRTQGH